MLETLFNVEGAFIFLESMQAAELIDVTHQFVQVRLYQQSHLPTAEELGPLLMACLVWSSS